MERYAAAGKGAGRRRRPAPEGRRDDTENVTGAQLRARGAARAHPATAFYIAQRVEMDDRVKEMLSIATQRGIP
jgi:23S rRNA (guanosine2251-2'-O)-methyltransferase